MAKQLREVNELPQPRPEILRRTGKRPAFAVLKDLNKYRNFEYHRSCLERALDFYPNSWRITFKATGYLATEAVQIFPSIMKQCNKNRHLRAQRFSGVRMCNLARRKNGSWHYITDVVLSDPYTTALFAHRLATSEKYFTNRWNKVHLFIVHHGKNSRERYAYTRSVEDRLRKIYKNCFPFETPFVRTIDDDLIELIVQGVSHTKLIAPLRVALEDLREDIEQVTLLGTSSLRIVRDKDFEVEEYELPFEDYLFAPIRYKHFQAFGTAYNNPQIL